MKIAHGIFLGVIAISAASWGVGFYGSHAAQSLLRTSLERGAIGPEQAEAAATSLASLASRQTAFSVAVTILSLALGGAFSWSISKRLNHLTETTASLGSGDLTTRADASGADEIAGLARRLNAMAEELNQAQESIAQQARCLEEQNRCLEAEIGNSARFEAEHRVIEVQLREAQKLEAIGQLAAGVAHEINTPIQYVGDNARFLKESFEAVCPLLLKIESLAKNADDDALRAYFAPILSDLEDADLEFLVEEVPTAIEQSLDGVQRVAEIVQAMKDFSHQGSGEEKTPLDLNRAIESTITVARNEWKYVATVSTDLDRDLPAVHCIAGAINQVILNLIVNAAHAIGDNRAAGSGLGTIRVSTKADGSWVEIRINDSGTGIPEDVQPRIFEPFFTTKEVGKGTGQGLSIAHNVVTTKHGGTLTFETTEGQGTTFVIRLPATLSEAELGASVAT